MNLVQNADVRTFGQVLILSELIDTVIFLASLLNTAI